MKINSLKQSNEQKTIGLVLVLFVIPFAVSAFGEQEDIFQIPNIAFDKYSYTWVEQGKLFVESPLDNRDAQKVDVITASNFSFDSSIQIYPDSVTLENFVLTETGPDTGVFEWSFFISDPKNKNMQAAGSNYITVSESTEQIAFQFDIDQNTGYSTTAKITYPDDNTLPSDEDRQRKHTEFPSIQFRNATLTSPYDGRGFVTVQYPSQNKSPEIAENLKIVFSAYEANRVFDILKETGPDTGIFEGEMSFSSYPSFSKIYLKKDDSNARSIGVYFLVSDSLSSRSNTILLHHGLEYSDSKGNFNHNSNLSVESERKAYLVNQKIRVSGVANPEEVIQVTLSSNRGSQLLFDKVHADTLGEFETEFSWEDSPPSGEYDLQAVSLENDSQFTKHITIASMNDLESRSIAIPPRQQSEMGIEPDQIVCKQVWKIILKPDGTSPSCVKLPTYTKLLERGWEASITNFNE